MNKNIEKQIDKNVKAKRIKFVFTQEELSAKLQTEGCDITRSALAKIEVGQRHLYLDELTALKKLLKTEYDFLLDTESGNFDAE